MDLLDRLLRHDAWTTKQLLIRCQELTHEQLDYEFDIGHRSVRATLVHIIYNLEAWSDCLSGRAIRNETGQSIEELIARLNQAADDFAKQAKFVSQRDAWNERWVDPTDGQERSYGGTIAHVITHSMHHRAQLLYLMRLLGLKDLPEGDVLSWESQTE